MDTQSNSEQQPPQDANVPAQPQQPAPSTSPPAEKKWSLGTWNFFFKFCAASLGFWLIELAYQYYSVSRGNATLSFIRASSLTGATLLGAALFSSAIFKWYPRTAKYWRLRRNLGVAGVIFITLHIYGVIFLMFNADLVSIFYTFNPIKNPLIFGAFAYVILLAMASTSTDWMVTKLGGKRWKTIHRFVYIAYASAILHFLQTYPAMLNTIAGYLLLTITALAAFGQIFWFFKVISKKHFRSLGTVVGFSIIIATLIMAYLVYSHDLRNAIELGTPFFGAHY